MNCLENINNKKKRTITWRFHRQKINLSALLGTVRFPWSFTYYYQHSIVNKLLKVKQHSKLLSNWPLIASGGVSSCDNEPFIRAGLMHYLAKLSLVHGARENVWLGRNKARSGAMLFQETLKWIQSHVINAKEALISQRLLKKVSIFRANGLVTTYWCTNIWPYQSRMSPKWFPSKTSLSVNCSFLS